MIDSKIEKLKKKKKELDKLPEVLMLKADIAELQKELIKFTKPYVTEIESLEDEIYEDINKRLKLLHSCGYKTNVSSDESSLEYSIENDIMNLTTCESYYGESNYYDNEIPLYLFTCSDKEVVKFINEQKKAKEQAKLIKKKQELLKELQELEEYEKQTGMRIKKVLHQ